MQTAYFFLFILDIKITNDNLWNTQIRPVENVPSLQWISRFAQKQNNLKPKILSFEISGNLNYLFFISGPEGPILNWISIYHWTPVEVFTLKFLFKITLYQKKFKQ